MAEIDIDLIRGLHEQSPKAQRQALEHYGNEVFAQVARMLPATEDAEEVYQDVFVKVFRNIGTYPRGDCPPEETGQRGLPEVGRTGTRNRKIQFGTNSPKVIIKTTN